MFCVMNIQKRKRNDISGIQKEATRTAMEYNNRVIPGMDILNVELVHSDNWMQDIQQEIDRAGVRVRSNSVVALDTIYTASPEFFATRNNAENDKFFQDCLKFHKEQFGHIISAVIHYDETTPHMHVVSVPLTKDNRLSARDVIGNRANMVHLQDEFFRNIGQEYGLERGIQRDGPEKRKHITAQEHELQKILQEKNKAAVELEAVKHSIKHSRERAQRAREQADKQETQNKALRAEESQIRTQTEREQRMARQLSEMNERARRKLQHTNERLQELEPYLQAAERRQLAEIARQQEREHEWTR